MSNPAPRERVLAACGAVVAFAASGWLAWDEWRPGGRAEAGAGQVEAGRAETIVERARSLVQDRRWEATLELLKQVSPDDPDADEAATLRTLSLLERRNRDVFTKLQQQLVDGDPVGAQATLKALPVTSAYRAEAEILLRGLK